MIVMYKGPIGKEQWSQLKMIEFLSSEAYEIAINYNSKEDQPKLVNTRRDVILRAVNNFLTGNNEKLCQTLKSDIEDEIEDIEKREPKSPRPGSPDRFHFGLSEDAREFELEQAGIESWEREYMQVGCSPDYV